ncbi:hypothetical protein C8R44DRAFT_882236 [Mycena epipterygia]|nr:hypothetical protein C8R44DRAFT_882236 [Mycena epipterygia]
MPSVLRLRASPVLRLSLCPPKNTLLPIYLSSFLLHSPKACQHCFLLLKLHVPRRAYPPASSSFSLLIFDSFSLLLVIFQLTHAFAGPHAERLFHGPALIKLPLPPLLWILLLLRTTHAISLLNPNIPPLSSEALHAPVHA